MYYDLDMKKIVFHNENITSPGLGTTGFWSGRNDGLEASIHRAYENYGITLFDTAEMYGDGKSETALGKTIREMERDRLFLVDKILPDHAVCGQFEKSLDESLLRLNTDYIDLYLLHWRENADLSFVVKKMHEARDSGKIRHWGVSNFDRHDLEDLFAAGGEDCFCNQIFYCLYERGAEKGLLSFMKDHDILPMSYSSLGSGYCEHPDIHQNHVIMDACEAYGVAPEAMMLRMNEELGFAALFSTSSPAHLEEDLKEVSEEAFAALKPVFDREYPAPDHPVPLAKI